MTNSEALQANPRQVVVDRPALAALIDDTRLVFAPGEDPEATIRSLCESARVEGFRAVCVRPQHVATAKTLLEGTMVKVAAVIGFPTERRTVSQERQDLTYGDIEWEVKAQEMQQAFLDGADEVDVMLNLKAYFAAEQTSTDMPTQYELVQLVEHAQERPIKLILETDLLGHDDIAKLTRAAVNAGIAYVKTSTGMLTDGVGASEDVIKRMANTIRETAGDAPNRPGVKASGGIRTATQAFDCFRVGADILGCGAGVAILDDFERVFIAPRQF